MYTLTLADPAGHKAAIVLDTPIDDMLPGVALVVLKELKRHLEVLIASNKTLHENILNRQRGLEFLSAHVPQMVREFEEFPDEFCPA